MALSNSLTNCVNGHIVPSVASKREWRDDWQSRLRDLLTFLVDGPTTDSKRRSEQLRMLRSLEGIPGAADTGSLAGAQPRAGSSPLIDETDAAAVADLLRHVHGDVTHGLRSLVRGERWDLPTASFSLAVNLTQERPPRRRYFLHAQTELEADNILLGVASLVRSHGETLRECERQGCGRIFLGRKRGAYCSPECLQLAMTARKTARRRQAAQQRRSKRATREDRRNG